MQLKLWVTMRDMCEVIVARGLVKCSPHELYMASPTGELAHVFLLYQEAIA